MQSQSKINQNTWLLGKLKEKLTKVQTPKRVFDCQKNRKEKHINLQVMENDIERVLELLEALYLMLWSRDGIMVAKKASSIIVAVEKAMCRRTQAD